MHRLGKKRVSQPNFVCVCNSSAFASPGDSVRTIRQDLYNCTFEKKPCLRRAAPAAPPYFSQLDGPSGRRYYGVRAAGSTVATWFLTKRTPSRSSTTITPGRRSLRSQARSSTRQRGDAIHSGRRDGRCASSVNPSSSPKAIPPATNSPSMGWPMSV